MPQMAKIVDLTRSFAVVDPNAFPQNMMYTAQEDSPEKEPPILGFEGYNFMPTSYGYKSFFGTTGTLNITALPTRCDEILLYQFANFQNVLVALCEDGLYVSLPAIAGNSWVKKITHTPPSAGQYNRWSYTIIENKLYLFRKGYANVYRILPTGIAANVVTVDTLTPTFLNMAGQEGIFRANGRLGFWDSANSVSWSSLFDHMDFTPALETLAGNSIFNAVVGRIVNILPQGDGFVIYTTKCIVGVKYSAAANLLWDASTITDVAGIAYPFQVCRGLTESEHFAFTNTGIKRIGAYNALNRSHAIEDVLTDVYDLLKESRQAVKMGIYNGRYLCFQVIQSDYIDGKTLFTYNTIDAIQVRILTGGSVWDGVTVLPVNVEGMSVTSHIAGQLNAGARQGLFTRWLGTLRTIFPQVTTTTSFPYYRDTYASPYDTTPADGGVHTPNTPEFSAPWAWLAPAASYPDTSYVNALVGVNPVQGLGTVFAAGDWIYPGLNNISAAYLGNTDAYLNEMIAVQTQEWDSLVTLQTNNKAALAAIPNHVATVQGTDPYVVSSTAQAVIDAAVAAGGGTGNTYVVSNTLVGSFLDGNGTSNAGAITGAGSHSATYSRTRTFLGGWDVYKKVTRVYSLRSAPGTNMFKFSWVDAIVPAGFMSLFPETRLGTGAGLTDITRGYTYGVSEANAIASAVAAAPNPSTSAGGLVATGPSISQSGGIYRLVYANLFNPFDSSNTPNVVVYQTGASEPVSVSMTVYYIDYTDTTTLEFVRNEALTLVSEMQAQQVVLEWGYFPEGVPVGPFTSAYGAFTIPGTHLVGTTLAPLDVNVTYPGASFNLQDGSLAPIYPSYSGALVLDLGLKKWGKLKATYKALVDYQPVNDSSQPVSYTNFALDLGMLDATGAIKLFDARPADSWIRYGKLGYYRLGYTQLHEVKVHFRNSSSGTIVLDSSMDGRALETVQQQTWNFNSVANTTVTTDLVGRWHTVKITGNYDLTYLEVRGTVAGRR